MVFQSYFWQCWIARIRCLYAAFTSTRKSQEDSASFSRCITFDYSSKRNGLKSSEECATRRRANNRRNCWKKRIELSHRLCKTSTATTKLWHKTLPVSVDWHQNEENPNANCRVPFPCELSTRTLWYWYDISLCFVSVWISCATENYQIVKAEIWIFGSVLNGKME